mgnify:CR=1 FL=1
MQGNEYEFQAIANGYNVVPNRACMLSKRVLLVLFIFLPSLNLTASISDLYPIGNEYGSSEILFSGKEIIILEGNAVTKGGIQKKLLYQSDFQNKTAGAIGERDNTIFVFKYDFELAENITIPKNCVLIFEGGSIKGGGINKNTITGNNTCIQSGQIKIFQENLTIAGKWKVVDWKLDWFVNIENGLDITSAIQSCLDMPAITCLEIPSGWYILSSTVIVPDNKTLKMQGHRSRYLLDAADVDPTETRVLSEGIKNGYMFDVRNKAAILGGAIIPGSDMKFGGAILIDIGKYRISSVFIKTDLCIRERKKYLSSNLTAIFIDGNYKKGGDSKPCGENFIFDVNITGFKYGVYFERLNEKAAPQLVWFNNFTITGWMAMCQRYMYSNCNTENHAGGAGYMRFSIQGAEVKDDSMPAIEWGGKQNVYDITFHDVSPIQSQKIRYKVKGTHGFYRRQKCDATVIITDYSVWNTFEEGPVIQELSCLSPNCSKSIQFISGYIEHSGHKHSVYLRCRINGTYTREQLLQLPHTSRSVVYADCFAETVPCLCFVDANGLYLKGTAYNSLLNIRIDYIDNDL